MIGSLHCYLVRLFGGKHKEKRVEVDRDNPAAMFNRICLRCSAIRMTRKRKAKA
jgi:hypothetical protein